MLLLDGKRRRSRVPSGNLNMSSITPAQSADSFSETAFQIRSETCWWSLITFQVALPSQEHKQPRRLEAHDGQTLSGPDTCQGRRQQSDHVTST